LIIVLAASFDCSAGQTGAADERLTAAKEYAEHYIANDLKPDQVFLQRQVSFPVWKDQPILDCGITSIVRAIRVRDPYYEDAKRIVVVVPVEAELLMVEMIAGSGYPYQADEEGKVQCAFEYERYSFVNHRFERLPGFLMHSHLDEFSTWGEVLRRGGKGHDASVAIAPDNRYVRVNFRIRVDREQPYAIHPQFPRHFMAQPAVTRLVQIVKKVDGLLATGRSDRDGQATGERLAEDMERMEKQNTERRWRIEHLEAGIERLRGTPSFSEIDLAP
jgi:hypothetical protein